jgi:hypothetical protein
VSKPLSVLFHSFCTEKIEQKTSRNYETKLKVVWTLDLDHHDARHGGYTYIVGKYKIYLYEL